MLKISEFLSHTYLFQAIPPEELNAIASFCRIHEGKKGELLFSEGQEAQAFYIVVYGKVKIFKLFAQGEEQILHLQGDGDVVAEAAIFNRIRYPGNAQLIKDSLLVEVPKDPLIQMILTYPNLALNMLSSYSRRLRQLITTIEYLSLKESRQKVALYLLKNGRYRSKENKQVCMFEHNKKEIAGIMGITPESFSRSLSNLKKSFIIEEQTDGSIIFDKDELEKLLS